MSKRTVNSFKEELIKKSRESMLAAVQIYNNPHITFKSETFITLAIISWTYLLHAYFRKKKVDYRYFSKKGKRKTYDKTKYNAYKHWELERCLNDGKCPLDEETKTNLKFLIGIRHEIEHQMTNKIDEYLSAKLQACSINYNYYLIALFGEKHNIANKLALSIQFSPLSVEQKELLHNNDYITTNVRNFIVDFENNIPEDLASSSRYAYRVLFTPINVNRKGKADKVIEFIPADSALAKNINAEYTLIKETEKQKYLPSQIVSIMKQEGFEKFNMNAHTEFWKSRDARNQKYHFGVWVVNKWYWYENWLNEVRKYCKENENKFKS